MSRCSLNRALLQCAEDLGMLGATPRAAAVVVVGFIQYGLEDIMCCNGLNRRGFLGASAAMLGSAGLAVESAVGAVATPTWTADRWDPRRPFRKVAKPLRVLPLLMYRVAKPRRATSYKSWGGVQSDQAADREAERIQRELRAIASRTEFELTVLPVAKVRSVTEAQRARQTEHDVAVVYPATGSGQTLRACAGTDGKAILFVRHRSGPTYYWYEALSVKYLETDQNRPRADRLSVHDVVVDDDDELLWRLRALHGVENFLGTRIVALGGAIGKYAADAPQIATTKYGFDIIDVSYKEFEPRITAALADKKLVAKAKGWTQQYLALPGTSLETAKPFVVNAFLLYGLFKDLMHEHGTTAFTIKDCMSTIMPMSKTTACLTLGLLNDEGLLAFCESDFVIIPAGILLRHITGKPAFLHNSTFPHQGMVTCAHCSAPRRMNAERYEPVRIVTHYESDYGAAPKVEIPKGQEVTFIDPAYTTGRWLGFKGNVADNPFYEICRSQQDVTLQGDWTRLLSEVRDSHWVMAYGDYLKEAGYAARKIGIRWETI